ncbi:hypothetical protein [Euryhalocaulis caribicus]|uniref:hypothetical protein n=1 Tax=Euryhalocaulis caribicus TaxID=1161401 RepID=UPI001267B7BC|nr:hypothetical protein [Euryhalocaulis caribicus]
MSPRLPLHDGRPAVCNNAACPVRGRCAVWMDNALSGGLSGGYVFNPVANGRPMFTPGRSGCSHFRGLGASGSRLGCAGSGR